MHLFSRLTRLLTCKGIRLFYCLSVVLVCVSSCASSEAVAPRVYAVQAQLNDVGAAQFEQYLPLLKGKRVAMVVNQSAVVSANEHLVDALVSKKVDIVRILSPEHGFRGDKGAGVIIDDDKDSTTGLPIYSLYGKTKKPTKEMLKGVDVIVFDLQDVGVRFYTYLSTLHYVLEAAAQYGVEVIVLDRPNPNGAFTDGPILSMGFQSFIGMHPIPVLHGMTLGELALMIKGERWIHGADRLTVSVIPVTHYHKQKRYSLPVAPSPNLPNALSVALYPTLCFFEGTDVSIGRGTASPFQLIGHPTIALGNSKTTIKATPAAPTPKHENRQIFARYLTKQEVYGLTPELWVEVYHTFAENKADLFTRKAFFDKLAGSSQLRNQIKAGKSAQEIRASWQAGLAAFKKQRAPYLLYPLHAPAHRDVRLK
jgi:uncharacterized protein YbbC (DUF1343 family)